MAVAELTAAPSSYYFFYVAAAAITVALDAKIKHSTPQKPKKKIKKGQICPFFLIKILYFFVLFV